MTMSGFEVEQDEMKKASPPVHLTPDLWVSNFLCLNESQAKLTLHST